MKGSVTCTVTGSDSTITNCDFDSSTDPTKVNVVANLAVGETITVLVKTTTATGQTSITNTATGIFTGESATESVAATATKLLSATSSNGAGLSRTGESMVTIVIGAIITAVTGLAILTFSRRTALR